MKTAIEILAEYPVNKDDGKLSNNFIISAMERFAEQEAKEFGKWFTERDSGNFDFDELYKKFKNGKN